MKKIKKLLLAGLALLTFPLLSLTSCSGFFKTDVVMIEDIVATTLSDGNLQLTITFTDDARDPITVIVPQGKPGNGIESITQEPNSTNTGTIITITYTDDNMAPLTFEVTNGVSISNIEETIDPETGNGILNVTLSNGETLTFTIPKGEDGKDGNSITNVSQETDENGNITLTFSFSEREDFTVVIPSGKQGEQGVSITNITLEQRGDKYVFTFYYSNGLVQTFDNIDKPATWLSGNGNPNDNNTTGYEGDFYFDLARYRIYRHNGTSWVLIADLDETGQKEVHTVTFDFNDKDDGSTEAILISGERLYEIENGRYFASYSMSLPIVAREGYEFMGWYSSPNYNVTMGAFTDMTPVYNDINLYARWSKN